MYLLFVTFSMQIYMSELEAVTLTYYGHCPFKLQGWGSWWRLSGSGSDPPEQKPNTDPSLKKNNLWMRLRPEEFTHNFLFLPYLFQIFTLVQVSSILEEKADIIGIFYQDPNFLKIRIRVRPNHKFYIASFFLERNEKC